jgi:hypothetical protein
VDAQTREAGKLKMRNIKAAFWVAELEDTKHECVKLIGANEDLRKVVGKITTQISKLSQQNEKLKEVIASNNVLNHSQLIQDLSETSNKLKQVTDAGRVLTAN